MAASPLPRVLRAAVFTAVCVALSTVAHRMMSGAAVPAWALVAAGAGVFAGACALLGRTCRFARVAGLMLAGEWALHTLFATAQQATAAPAAGTDGTAASLTRQWSEALLCGPGTGASTWPGGASLASVLRAAGMNPTWAHLAPTAVGAAVPSPGMGDAGGMAMPGMAMPGGTGMAMGHETAGMIAAHAVAGLVCAWWLWRGENAAVDMLRALAMTAMAPPRLAVTAAGIDVWLPRRRHTVVTTRPVRVEASVLWVAHTVVRRGPPPVPAF